MKVRVEAYGCTMNQGEGSVLEKKLESLGHEVVQSAEDADLVVLNTCTVIRPTEMRMTKRMKEISRQGKHLIVTGCMASVQSDQIKDIVPDALIISPFEYDYFSPLITDHFGVGAFTQTLEPDIVTAIVPIAQGCLGSCTYCITRMARGRLRSYAIESVVEKCRKSVAQGAKELLVTAQDTACYGLDQGRTLGELMRAVSSLPGKFRIRIGMMNPDSLQKVIEDLLPAWESDKVYKFLHLPVQSGSDRILKDMGRHYTVDDFKRQVERFRERFRDLTLSTDVITGFPGETDKDHESTMELIREVRPSIVNVTRYSPRPGTIAAKSKNQVPGWVSKERSRSLTQLRFKIGKSVNIGKEGDREEVLIAEKGKDDTYIGRTISYTPVVIEEGVRLGEFVDVNIVRSASTHLFGRLV
ncbi:MAG: tRNA (N(6)-L-threonylcarbamoyladenosine(37)-C(2))-methylthiotransferase [Methanomassiliicoccales archaeon]|nr:tRNA (N(6)-L-threonylcarbamoyladenosine(37)-C(2))-methylthiotransferase [Methanomassiliicoccales archaeon]